VIVMKFGGSSVATAAAIARVRSIVSREPRPRVIVVSALGGVTDDLLSAAASAETGDLRQALRVIDALGERHRETARAALASIPTTLLPALDHCWFRASATLRAIARRGRGSARARDEVAACGELASSLLVRHALEDAGLPAEWIDARRAIATDGRHGSAAPLYAPTAGRLRSSVLPVLGRGGIPVVGGFVGSTLRGVTTTLGRGGSDLSASLVGACLDAEEIQIWTDVDGLLTADPRVFDRPRPVAALTFGEAGELAHFGAKVLHPAAVDPAANARIPVRILNSIRPGAAGTLIAGHHDARPGLAALASHRGLAALDVDCTPATRERVLVQLFSECARAMLAVHLAALADSRISIVAGSGAPLDRVAKALGRRAGVRRREGLALLAAVGEGLRERGPGEERAAAPRWSPADVFAALSGIPLHLVSRAPGSRHIAFVLADADLPTATARLHHAFLSAPVWHHSPAALRVAAAGGAR